MATADVTAPSTAATPPLSEQWRSLTRIATLVALLTSPAAFVWFHSHEGLRLRYALLLTLIEVAAFRGLVDVVFRRFIASPSLFGEERDELRHEDVVMRRRLAFWRMSWRWAWRVLFLITTTWLVLVFFGHGITWGRTAHDFWHGLSLFGNTSVLGQFIVLPFFFLFNFLIFFGPMMAMGISQVRGYQPGDAEWGVKLEHVRGQAEAKEDIRRIVSLWQSGERFERAGGKRERGLLFLGAPGTGKTMLAKAIATGFNCFDGEQRFLTRGGLKSLASTVDTTQLVLNGNGEWVPAEVRRFGRQPLVSIEFRLGLRRRSHVRHAVHATADHRWFTENRGIVTDLRLGDLVRFQGAPETDLIPEAFAAGFGYGDGTIGNRGRARVRLCGAKDAAHLPVLVAAAPTSVMSPPSFEGDTLLDYHRGHLAAWKELPLATNDPDWLASWLEGLLAADGWIDGDAVVLELQDSEAVEFVRAIAPFAGYMVTGYHVKSNEVTNYGRRRRPLVSLELRREGVWRVSSVVPLAEERDVYCVVEPRTGAFVLEHGILTGNCPFVTIPGSGFAQTFIGLDSILVRYIARKAKRLARKWGGQCIVFIDEIDAVGRRRNALAGGTHAFEEPTFEQSGDLVLETRAWRDKQFALRAPEPRVPSRLNQIVNQGVPGGMFGGMGSMALNQLLVVMDGLDSPPLGRRVLTGSVNTMLDALYFIPSRWRGRSLRLPPPRPRPEQIYFIGATNVPIEQLDPALTRPGRMGRHVWFRTPTKTDREDIFDLYLGKVSHVPELDTPKRRDELARMTMGYSPAMIEQVCSMALTIAHHSARDAFGWEDIVEAMTTVESGTAINIEYVPEETRAIAIHEAGHAVAAHAYLKGAESTRLSIRRRGGSLGHHMAMQKEERFSSWRSEEMARLIWALGAMAAERVVYGENSTGVGGDVQAATDRAAWMVGACGMAPEFVELRCDDESEEEARERVMKRFQRIGTQIVNRTGAGQMEAGVLRDPSQRAMVEQLLGQAYLAAHHLIESNREAVEHVADELVARRELYGDEVLELLDRQELKLPEFDLTRDEAWPKL